MNLIKNLIKILERVPIISNVLEYVGCEIHLIREQGRLQALFGKDVIDLYASSDAASTSKPLKNQHQ